MQNLNTVLRAIPAPDTDAMARAQQHIDGLPSPRQPRRLEALAVQLAECPAWWPAAGGEKALLVMCADHGVWDEGWRFRRRRSPPSRRQMTHGTTGVCVLAAQAGAKVHVIDVGIDSEPLPGVVNMRVARAAAILPAVPAMSREQGRSCCWR